jgi:hypothetical protein
MKVQGRQNEADGSVRWLEVFEIRSSISNKAAIESKLETLKRNLHDDGSIESVEFYCHADVPTDWCIHLHYTSDSQVATGNALGLHILSILQELGSVYHSIWGELRSTDVN